MSFRSVISALPNISTSVWFCRNKYNTKRRAVLRPIPGSLANSSTAFSNNFDGYLSFIINFKNLLSKEKKNHEFYNAEPN
jgi:hypothetical protein